MALPDICFGPFRSHHTSANSRMVSEVTCRMCLESMQGEWIVCDRCRVRHDSGDIAAFVKDHIEHNFTGLRIVKIANPCPNRARDYRDV